MEAATKCEQLSEDFSVSLHDVGRNTGINRSVYESGIKQAIRSCGEQDEKSDWEEDTTEKHLAVQRDKSMEDEGTERERERAAEIHLEFEIKVAAGAVTNPVGLHGFDTIPLWEVCQGVQERLGDRDRDAQV